MIGDARALIDRLGERLPLTREDRRDGEEVDEVSAIPTRPTSTTRPASRRHWSRLHRATANRCPRTPPCSTPGSAFHAGDFARGGRGGARRRRRRRQRGGEGPGRSTRPTSRRTTRRRLALFEEAAGWAEARRRAAPKDANAHYLYAFALGRYSQGISVAKALAQGFGGKIKEALTTTLKLEPKHADAHIAYGAYQAEVIDKVGGIVAGMTYGAKKDSALEHFEKALKLNPDSAIARIEYANGLIMLFGKARSARPEALRAGGGVDARRRDGAARRRAREVGARVTSGQSAWFVPSALPGTCASPRGPPSRRWWRWPRCPPGRRTRPPRRPTGSTR